MSFWPGPGWPPWDALAAAGIVVADDRRNLSPPCALVEIDEAAPMGGCGARYTVHVRLVASGPDNADARKWLWTKAAVPLLPLASSLRSEEWEGYPTALAVFEEEVQ